MTIAQLFDSALSVFGVRTAEEPRYQVIDRIGDVEIRRYGPRFAAETTVQASENEGMNQAFYILAGYIFGGNERKQDIAMTAPVAMRRGEQIAMTAPVATGTSPMGGLTMRFFLPAEITPSTAPRPNDKRVKLIEVPAETLAALRFAGSWSKTAIAARKNELMPSWRGQAGSRGVNPSRNFTIRPSPFLSFAVMRSRSASRSARKRCAGEFRPATTRAD